MSVAQRVVDLLIEKGLTIATAESCTGGLIASAIVDIADASKVLYEGVVTYSNEAKIARLGVQQSTLSKHGAVSPETACQMAEGLLVNADVGVSTTGIAGPSGGTAEKPVGLVYIAVAGKNGTTVAKNVFNGSRNEVRELAKNTALNMVLEYINKY